MSNEPLIVSAQTIEKWLTLAQRRCAYIEELHQSGRWQRFYREPSALRVRMQSAVQDAENCAKVLEHAMSKERKDGLGLQPHGEARLD